MFRPSVKRPNPFGDDDDDDDFTSKLGAGGKKPVPALSVPARTAPSKLPRLSLDDEGDSKDQGRRGEPDASTQRLLETGNGTHGASDRSDARHDGSKGNSGDDGDDDDDEEAALAKLREARKRQEAEEAGEERRQSVGSSNGNTTAKGDGDDVDPLDAFMALNAQQQSKPSSTAKAIRGDIEEEDDMESYFREREEYLLANPVQSDDEDDGGGETQYDDNDNPIVPARKKEIEPLPPKDHSAVPYIPIEKCFYEEHGEIASLTPDQVDALRKKLDVRVSGADVPKPCVSFAHFGFEKEVMTAISKHGYFQPTPIQSQAIPAALSGRDIIGIAKTGSGKTAAFLLPMIVHLMDQPELEPGDGPIGVVVAPTRELCQQIYNEACKFGKCYSLRVAAIYGGESKYEQSKVLQAGCEMLVATPGRLIDMIKSKIVSMVRTSFLVLDEADKMFNMGFEPQVRSIISQIRPDRQTLLFSATFKKRIEKLARDALTSPVRIVVGDVGEANQDVTQIPVILKSNDEKMAWLLARLVEFTSTGSVLVFATRKADCQTVTDKLNKARFEAQALHGDVDQNSRNTIISKFKKKAFPILVATDVAARGLDINHIKTVVNYDIARDIDTHTHRIGRTGRAGEKGTAYTLLLPKDTHFAGELVHSMESASQRPPKELLDLAHQHPSFHSRAAHRGGGRGRGRGAGRGGGRGAIGNYTGESGGSSAQGRGSRFQPASEPSSVEPSASVGAAFIHPSRLIYNPALEKTVKAASAAQSQAPAQSSSSPSSSSSSSSSAGAPFALGSQGGGYQSRFQHSAESSWSSSGARPPQQPAQPAQHQAGGDKPRASRWE